MTKEELETYKKWLESSLKKTPKHGDRIDHEHRDRTLQHIDDINWRLEIDPPREEPTCGADLPYRLHKEACPDHNPCYAKPICRRMVRDFADFSGVWRALLARYA